MPDTDKTTQSIIIRELIAGDLDDHFISLLEQLTSVAMTPDSLRTVHTDRISRGIRTYGLYRDSLLAATASLVVEPKFIHGGKRVGHLEEVVVDRDYRGEGLGERIVRYVAHEAITRLGCYKVILNCVEDNIGFYQKTGFRLDTVGMRLDAAR